VPEPPSVPRCVRAGLWRSPDGRVEVERRDDADTARREWVLRVDGGVIDNGLGGHIDFPTLGDALHAAADEVGGDRA
jgi:hypothetical protein